MNKWIVYCYEQNYTGKSHYAAIPSSNVLSFNPHSSGEGWALQLVNDERLLCDYFMEHENMNDAIAYIKSRRA